MGLHSLSGRMSYRKKTRSREIQIETFPMAFKFDRYIGSAAVEMPVKFQSDNIANNT